MNRHSHITPRKKKKSPIFTTVGKSRWASLEQVRGYAMVLATGAADGRKDSGVDGEHVWIQAACGILHSSSLVAVGGRNTPWRSGGAGSLSYKCKSM